MRYTLLYRRGSFPISENFNDLDQAVLRGQAMAREHHASCISVTKEGLTIMSQAELLSTDIDLDQSLTLSPNVTGVGER